MILSGPLKPEVSDWVKVPLEVCDVIEVRVSLDPDAGAVLGPDPEVSMGPDAGSEPSPVFRWIPDPGVSHGPKLRASPGLEPGPEVSLGPDLMSGPSLMVRWIPHPRSRTRCQSWSKTRLVLGPDPGLARVWTRAGSGS